MSQSPNQPWEVLSSITLTATLQCQLRNSYILLYQKNHIFMTLWLKLRFSQRTFCMLQVNTVTIPNKQKLRGAEAEPHTAKPPLGHPVPRYSLHPLPWESARWCWGFGKGSEWTNVCPTHSAEAPGRTPWSSSSTHWCWHGASLFLPGSYLDPITKRTG